jgi:acetoin utilization protein AcuB
MFVRNFMTLEPAVVSPDDNFTQAMHILRKCKVRHLPVIENNRLVGVVVEKDLLSNQPSQATTLSLYEIYSLLESLRIRQMMSYPAITVEGDCPLEEAARIMVENTISCLPVMDGDKLVGIITETDIFKALVELFGGEAEGVRLVLRTPDRVGQLAKLVTRIAEAGGNILAVTNTPVLDDCCREVMIKETGAKRSALLFIEDDMEVKVIDARPTTRYEPHLFG